VNPKRRTERALRCSSLGPGDAVHAGGGPAVEGGLLSCGGLRCDPLEGVPQLGIAAGLLVRRKVALEYAALGPGPNLRPATSLSSRSPVGAVTVPQRGDPRGPTRGPARVKKWQEKQKSSLDHREPPLASRGCPRYPSARDVDRLLVSRRAVPVLCKGLEDQPKPFHQPGFSDHLAGQVSMRADR
jgi:hypothetical protein